MVEPRGEVRTSYLHEMENGVKRVVLTILQEHGIDETELTPEELASIKELAFASGLNWSLVLSRISTRIKFAKVGPD